MNIDANDPMWTAYALGEITDERKRIEIEKVLRESPEIAAFVEDIRETATWLKEELTAEQVEWLTPEQRKYIEAKASKSSRFLLRWKPVWAYAITSAAILVALVTVHALRQTDIFTPTTALTAEVFEKTSPVMAIDREQSADSELFTIAEIQNPISAQDHGIVSDSGEIRKHSDPPLDMNFELKPYDGPTEMEHAAVTADGMVLTTPPPVEIPTQTLEDTLMAASNIINLINIMGGVEVPNELYSEVPPSYAYAGAPASGINIMRDGITTSEIRNNSGTVGPSRMNMEQIGELKMKLPPMDAEYNPGKEQISIQRPGFNTEAYEYIDDNSFLDAARNPLSTFSIDVDTASYSNMRRFLDRGSMPPNDSIRIEELVNYFDYDYQSPQDGKPFAANVEMTEAPWNPQNKLLRIGLKGREIAAGRRPESNLVFLIDVSGSMSDQNKLPLVKESMMMLVDNLTESDRVALVVYAGYAGIRLPSTRGDMKQTIRNAINALIAGGSTSGASGIQLAYQVAQENFIKDGVNRVILATDGDFNVGITNRGDLTRLIEEKAKSGIYLSALGFGMNNYKDATLELLADKGRGNYAYIDNVNEARKVLVEQMDATLVAIAQDVKIQVEFNPAHVKSYRLLGYENRIMAKEDFNNDAKMAGVIGAGHTVTALYELNIAGTSDPNPDVDPLRYQKPSQFSNAADSGELATLKIRSKDPEKDTSVLTEFVIKNGAGNFAAASGDFKFAAAVAAFGMTLRNSPYKGDVEFNDILDWANEGRGADRYGYRDEFIRLVHRAASIPRQQ